MSAPIGIASRLGDEDAHEVSPSPAPRYVPRGVRSGYLSPPLLSAKPTHEQAAASSFQLDGAVAEASEKGIDTAGLSALWQLTKKYLPTTSECIMHQIAQHIEVCFMLSLSSPFFKKGVCVYVMAGEFF